MRRGINRQRGGVSSTDSRLTAREIGLTFTIGDARENQFTSDGVRLNADAILITVGFGI